VAIVLLVTIKPLINLIHPTGIIDDIEFLEDFDSEEKTEVDKALIYAQILPKSIVKNSLINPFICHICDKYIDVHTDILLPPQKSDF
jgi:hypothetical protein